MNISERKIHRVRFHTPLDASVNPYTNRLRAVRSLHYQRLYRALNLIERTRSERVLELGCWAGYFLPSLLKYFPEVWGVDDDSCSVLESAPGYSSILQIARKLCEAELGSTSGLHLTKATGSALPFHDRYFDVVVCMDTLANIERPSRFDVVNELRRVTRLDGQLIFSLPIEVGPASLLKEGIRLLTGKRIDSGTKQYDFRDDLELLRTTFPLCRPQFFPVNILGKLSTVVIVDCRTV